MHITRSVSAGSQREQLAHQSVARRVSQDYDSGNGTPHLRFEAVSPQSQLSTQTQITSCLVPFWSWPARDHKGRNSAAGTEVTFDFGPHRLCPAHHIFENLIDDVLLEDSEIAIGLQIFFVRFQFEAAFVGHITKDDYTEI